MTVLWVGLTVQDVEVMLVELWYELGAHVGMGDGTALDMATLAGAE
jgi:hypothetical protein